MYYGMYLAAAGAAAQNRRMEVVAHNIANSSTTGFKRELQVLQARATATEESGSFLPTDHPQNIGGGVRAAESITDYSVGPLRHTGVDTDFALERPDAFFVVERDGQEFLTRAGNFHFTSEGRLVNDAGLPVVSGGGGPVQIDPTFPWSVTDKGEIVQGGDGIPLAIKRPAQLGDLAREGDNLFRSVGPTPTPLAAEDRNVRWQHLEMSSVQPQREIVTMIETQRAYEANVRMMQNHDNILGSIISRLLRA